MILKEKVQVLVKLKSLSLKIDILAHYKNKKQNYRII